MKIWTLLKVAAAAFFFASAAHAQTSGTVTNHAFAIGKGPGQTGYTSLLCGSAQLAVGQTAADPICRTLTGDVTIAATGVTTIGATRVTSAMLNADVYSTAHSWSGQQTFVAPILGTPASGTLTNATGLPISTGVAGLGTGVATFLATPSSANLRAALTDESGTGAALFAGGDLGTPSAGVLTNATGLPVGGIAAVAANTLLGNFTTSSAIPTATDPSALTTKASPAAGDYIILSDQAASGQIKKATVSSVASAGSVASLNGSTGAIVTGLEAGQNCSLAVSAAASALTIALKDAGGSDPSAGSPCAINFPSATTTTGTYATLSATAATSLVVSSGSTLGVTSSTAFRLWVVAFNDAGTFRIGVINASTATAIFPLNDYLVASSTAEGGAGAADSAGVFYTGTAVSAKAYRILGFVEWSSSGLTAGTWTTSNLLYVRAFGIGVRLPGDVVQIVAPAMTTSGTTTTSGTYTVTSNTASITPSSAANKIRVTAMSNAFSANAANYSRSVLRRGTTTDVSPIIYVGGSTNSQNGVNHLSFDFPNTASSQAYSVYVSSHDGVNSVQYNPSLLGATMRLEEIQG